MNHLLLLNRQDRLRDDRFIKTLGGERRIGLFKSNRHEPNKRNYEDLLENVGEMGFS